jgi:predicted acyl esterase
VQLALSLYKPAGLDRYATLLWIQTSGRESFNPRTGEITPIMRTQDITYFTANGYAIALAEMIGASYQGLVQYATAAE